MSTIGITTDVLSKVVGIPSAASQFVTDLNQLAQDLQSGNLSAAEQDYAEFSENALNNDPSSTAATSARVITTTLPTEIASSSENSTSFASPSRETTSSALNLLA